MFFRKKAVVVNIVNQKDLPDTDDQEKVDPNFGAHVYVLVNNAVYGAALLMGAYFLGDTLRHSIIHTVAVRVQPPVVIEAVKSAKK